MTERQTRSMRGLTTTEVIQCLRDGSRDMTQVIYRQIPEMDIFNENGSLRGQPMFRVNYCGNHCSSREWATHYTWDIARPLDVGRGDEHLPLPVALHYHSWAGVGDDGQQGLDGGSGGDHELGRSCTSPACAADQSYWTLIRIALTRRSNSLATSRSCAEATVSRNPSQRGLNAVLR